MPPTEAWTGRARRIIANALRLMGGGLGSDKNLVQCSVFAPDQARAGLDVMVQVFAHPPNQADVVATLATQFDTHAVGRSSKLLDEHVAGGTRLSFYLRMNGLVIAEPVQSLTWRGQPDAVQFAVHVPAECSARDVVGTVLVTEDSVPFGHLKFILHVAATPDFVSVHTTLSGSASAWKRYEYAFICYASEDRPEVLRRVQMLPRLHVDFFRRFTVARSWGSAGNDRCI